MDLISPAEYARHRGVTRAAVSKAIRSGRITLIGKLLDPVAADAQWEANTDPAQSMRASGARAANGAEPASPLPEGGAPGRGSADGRALLEAKRRRETALAEIAELELEEKRGALVNVAQLEAAYLQMIGAFKSELMARDDKLKAELDGIYGIDVDVAVLRRYTFDSLTHLSEYDPASNEAPSTPDGD